MGSWGCGALAHKHSDDNWGTGPWSAAKAAPGPATMLRAVNTRPAHATWPTHRLGQVTMPNHNACPPVGECLPTRRECLPARWGMPAHPVPEWLAPGAECGAAG